MMPMCNYGDMKGVAMDTRTNTEKMQLRLPPEIKLWLTKQSNRNGSSQNSEIIRAIRERMDREAAGRAA